MIKYLMLTLFLFFTFACHETKEPIYDEYLVPEYLLPDLFTDHDGDTIRTREDWSLKRRNFLLTQFESEVYGAYPDKEYTVSFSVEKTIENFLDSSAILKEILVTVTTNSGKEKFRILTVFPKSDKPVPLFVGLNFYGNHTIDSCPEITIHDRWTSNNEKFHVTDNRADEMSRGVREDRWPLSTIINRGYGIATVYYGEFDPDYDDGFKNGFHPLFAENETGRKKDDPGSLSIWAKGMSLMVDYLVNDPSADPHKIICIGHSRLGKTALWAGVNDERFAAVISNNSGCGGAALSRRNFGETVESINDRFPHWFCDNFKKYNRHTDRLPVDQHMLLALVAPRPVYVASATEDQWADPNGEFLALKEASRVYGLFGFEQDFPASQPKPDQTYHGITGYHLRTGVHDITESDWVNYLDWCDAWVMGNAR